MNEVRRYRVEEGTDYTDKNPVFFLVDKDTSWVTWDKWGHWDGEMCVCGFSGKEDAEFVVAWLNGEKWNGYYWVARRYYSADLDVLFKREDGNDEWLVCLTKGKDYSQLFELLGIAEEFEGETGAPDGLEWAVKDLLGSMKKVENCQKELEYFLGQEQEYVRALASFAPEGTKP